ncbi:MAG: type I-E CRISPR-associated protein Cse1/CasA [Spirochaetota bacterium]
MNEYNLVSEPWIPIAGGIRASLQDIFSDNGPTYHSLVGDPIQKLSLFKFLLAVVQSAWTPTDIKEWKEMGVQGMKNAVRAYLTKWKEVFYLYGEHPFLQMPQIKGAKIKTYGTFLPMVATGNTTVFTELNVEHNLSDAERALLLIRLMSFALGGKQIDGDFPPLSHGYDKSKSARPGPGVGSKGLLHSFVLYKDLLYSLWLNLFTEEEIRRDMQFFTAGLGVVPWEQMPSGEDDSIARQLKRSYIGRLVPLSRFVLFEKEGLHCIEGVSHSTHEDGIFDPSITVNFTEKKPIVKWANVERRPWRELVSLLSFMDAASQKWNCLQLKHSFDRLASLSLPEREGFTLWVGGMQISNKAGEQYFSGNDDFVESEVQFACSVLTREATFFANLQKQMQMLEEVEKLLKENIKGYYAEIGNKNGTTKSSFGSDMAKQGAQLFWQKAETVFPHIIHVCESSENEDVSKQEIRKQIVLFAQQSYDFYCPHETAQQLDAWVKHRSITVPQ